MPIFKEFTKKLLLRITKFLGPWCTHKPNLAVIQLWWTRNYYLSLWCIHNPNLAVKQLWWTHSYHLSIGCDAVITPTWLWCSYDELIISINTRRITITIVSTITKPLVELNIQRKSRNLSCYLNKRKNFLPTMMQSKLIPEPAIHCVYEYLYTSW